MESGWQEAKICSPRQWMFCNSAAWLCKASIDSFQRGKENNMSSNSIPCVLSPCLCGIETTWIHSLQVYYKSLRSHPTCLTTQSRFNTACCFAADPDIRPAPKQVSRVKQRGYTSHFADLVLLVESPESVLLLRYHPVLQDPLCLSEALHEGVDKAVKLFRLRAEIYTGYLSHIHRLSIH